jgi:PKD repeat protein
MNTKNYATKNTTRRLFSIGLMLIVFLTHWSAMAQDACMMVPLPMSQRVQQSTVIVEGKVLSQESFWGIGRRNIFTRNVVEVYKVFKGTGNLRTIEVITQGGQVGDIGQQLSASLELHVGDMGILTCIPNPYQESGIGGYTAYGSMQGFIKYDEDGGAHDPFNTYKNINEDVYKSIRKITNRPVQEIAPNTTLEALKRRLGNNTTNRVSNPNSVQATPTISGFSPTSITSGTSSNLTITGTNFGATQGTGFVEFKNANDGGGTWVKPLTTDYVSWSNTQIVVKVPSTSQSGPGAGTGQVRVTNSDASSNQATSSGTLTITYAYSNYPKDNYARIPTHTKDNSFGGYTFTMNSSFASNSSAVSKMRAILNTWTCASGMNWLLDSSTTAVASVASDGINVMTFVPSLSAGVLASCSSWYYSCGTGATSSVYVGEIDVVISSAFTWYYGVSTTVPAGQYDFESVMLHEMGHGHQLNHSIDAAAVMHYSISSAQAKRTLNANEIAGAVFVKNRDITIGTVCGSAQQMTVLACNAGTSAPLVTFTANRTNVVAGCTAVTFTPEAAPEVTSWSWNFGGGATNSTLQTPTVTFSTAGTYTVTLTATNAFGSTPFTRTSYITVTAPVCTATNNNYASAGANITEYNHPTSGKLIGLNGGLDVAFADKFLYCGVATKLTQLKYYFNTHSGTGNITAKVWSADGSGGSPGTELFSQTVAISAIQTYPTATVVTLPSALSITGDYFIGFQVTPGGSDTLGLVSTVQGATAVSSAWRKSSANVWNSYLDLYSSTLCMLVDAVFNNTPTASISAGGATTFCDGSSVTLTANSGAGYTYLWLKGGVSTGVTTQAYSATTTGNYTVQVSYGSCTTTSAVTAVTVNPCNNADLSNLVSTTGPLTPVFATATTSYTISVPNTTATMNVIPTASDSGATIKVNGVTVVSGNASLSLPLNVGSNTINTVVTAQNGTTTKTYTITVTRAAPPSTNANLSNLVPSTGSLSPAFAQATTAYTMTVPFTTTSMTVTPTVADATATVKVNTVTVASGSPSGSIALAVGSNTISTVVTAEDGTTTKTYTITVTRTAGSTNANLSGLVPSTGTLSPTFAQATTSYTMTVPFTTTSMTVTPTVADATATVKVNSVTVTSGSPSGSIALSVGSNTITTVVTAQDGTTTKTYTITVTRTAASTNNNLSNLVPSTGTLSPSFAQATIAYTMTVPFTTSSMTVTPTVADSFSTVTVNAAAVTSGFPSGSIALAVGSNTITTVVTAQSGTTKTYTITVTRTAASTNNNLSNLVPSTGALSPSFAQATIAYTMTVPFATASMTVTPTVADSFSTVTVNTVAVTSGSPSGSIALAVGSNTITTVVTAQNGTTKTYMITVTRSAASTNANLSNLVPSTGALSPSFAQATIAYTMTVPNATSSMTVTPTAADATATIKVNTVTVVSGAASGSIALAVGSNTITTVVTAQDGTTTKTYTITVTRLAAPSTNANLSNLVPSTGSLSPAFAQATTSYTMTVPFTTSSMTVTPTVADVTATVKVNTVTVTSGTPSGPIALAVGNTTITTVVTAQDGTTTKTYTITVTRTAASTVSSLSNLVPSTGALSPGFGSATLNYTMSVPNATSSMTLTPTATQANATITVNSVAVASGVASGPISLNVGTNTITTVVTAQNGTSTTTYTVTVTRAPGAGATLVNLKLYIEGYYIGSGMMNSVKFNQDGVSNATFVEDLTVELRHATTLALIASTTATLKTDGTMACSFPTSPSGSYYIVVKGRNMVETWSGTPQTVGAVTLTYDFSNLVSKAYGSNMVPMESGVFAVYSGDTNDDGFVEFSDYTEWEADANDFASGEFPTDLNGDGFVEFTDYTIWESNSNKFIEAIRP